MAGRHLNRTRLDPATRRTQILDVAERLLSQPSGSDLTFDALADEAGISRALVYNYFGDRSGLIAAVELRLLERLNSTLDGALDYSLRPDQQLRVLADTYRRFAINDHGLWRVLVATSADHPSLVAARRLRSERLAAAWGSSPRAVIAAQAVTVLMESVTLGLPPEERLADSDGVEALDQVCSILADGLSTFLVTPEAPAAVEYT